MKEKVRLIKIGINAQPLAFAKTGVANYIDALLEGLIVSRPDDTFYLYAPIYCGELLKYSKYKNVEIRISGFLKSSITMWTHITLSILSQRDRVDVLWCSTQMMPWFLSPTIQTIYTVHDFTYLLFPKTVAILRRIFMKYFAGKALKRADSIMSNSDATKNKLELIYAKKTSLVIKPAVSKISHESFASKMRTFLKGKNWQYKGYLLTVATWEPRKNLEFLLCAYQKLLNLHTEEELWPLVLVGKDGWKNQKLKQELALCLDHYPSIFHVTGYINEEELHYLYAGARQLLCLSLYEGYGMPVAEARLHKTPVVCNDIPELREAAEDDGIFIQLDHDSRSLDDVLKRGLCCVEPTGVCETRYETVSKKIQRFSNEITRIADKKFSSCF